VRREWEPEGQTPDLGPAPIPEALLESSVVRVVSSAPPAVARGKWAVFREVAGQLTPLSSTLASR
jgi:hypothetical protein